MKRMSFAVLTSLFFLYFPHLLFFPQPFLKPHLLSPFSSFLPLAEWWSESVSHSAVFNSLRVHGQQPTRLLCPWDSPDTNTGVGCHCLLQGIFPTQGLNPSPLHCRQILYHLNPPREAVENADSAWPKHWDKRIKEKCCGEKKKKGK